MHINEIKIMQRKNLGNYEHREVTINASLTEGDNFNEAYDKVNQEVKHALGYGYVPVPQPVSIAQVEKGIKEVEAKEKPAPPKKKRAPAKKKDPVVVPTLEEMMALCRDTANRLKSAEKVKALMSSVCGVETLKDANENTFVELKTKLNDAK